MNLAGLLRRSARRHPDRPAVIKGAESFTYRQLDQTSDRFARFLVERGVSIGDRVAVWGERSPTVVAAMQAVLRAGAAYVPIDPLVPAARAGTIVEDCAAKIVLTTKSRADAAPDTVKARCVVMDDLEELLGPHAPEPPEVALDSVAEDALAYILYTSGSTGKPKGVCISHRNALAFIEWAVEELDARETDRFANHALFGFDISVLDLYGALSVGASVSIIPDGAAYSPEALVHFVKESRPSIWYSIPTALVVMIDRGGLLDLPELPMRAVLFAGEAFPIKYVRRLRERWPSLRLLNLYGPTETNVCTFHEVREIDPERTRPVPIGRACSGDEVWLAREDGSRAGPDEDEGLLMVEGPTVMLGYWGKPPQGRLPYATGDRVRRNADGDLEYLGRNDNMVKVRGFRVELGEIEATLNTHSAIREAAAVVTGAGVDAKLVAVLVPDGDPRPGLLELKRLCADRLPRYMIVDRARWVEALPRSANGKIDRKKLAEELEKGTP